VTGTFLRIQKEDERNNNNERERERYGCKGEILKGSRRSHPPKKEIGKWGEGEDEERGE